MIILLLLGLGALEAAVLFEGSLDSQTKLIFEDSHSQAKRAALEPREPLQAQLEPEEPLLEPEEPPLEPEEPPLEPEEPPLAARPSAWRPGSPTKTNSCHYVRAVPAELRRRDYMFPYGLTSHYQRYTEAYGIPVVSSSRVPDAALQRACYVLRFMMADHSGIRNNFYKRHGRVGVMASTEVTRNIPEHSWLAPSWDTRARGLGATNEWPISTGAEENILCHARDNYRVEDIFLHEFSHGVHILGAAYAISGWESRLANMYNARRYANTRWANTYAMSTKEEYFAEGVQSFFNCNAYANPPNGVHNHVDTRDKLLAYDRELYNLVSEVFPCRNPYIERCPTGQPSELRAAERAQVLKMNCDQGDGEEDGGDGDDDEEEEVCVNAAGDTMCNKWGKKDHCEKKRRKDFMSVNCQKTCGICGDTGPDPKPSPDCKDLSNSCAGWKTGGYCDSAQYHDYMSENCKKSCGYCGTSGCKNIHEHCPSWGTAGYCTAAEHQKYMTQNCKKTCGTCAK